MGFEKLLNKMGFEVEWEDEEDTGAEDKSARMPRKTEARKAGIASASVSAASLDGVQIVTVEPVKVGDAKEICNHLKEGKTVVLNVARLGEADIVRLFDFITGAAYALNGKVKEISETVLVIVPHNVEIQTNDIDTRPAYEVSYEEDYEDVY